ncbi:unnamed protein product [Clavelina lepadiformis]|uniref:Uncharacterized protein n=1 Tax=Clavelina lepadiformis TaxID=159417 RepID=A0ABP0FSD1_CLALP
MIGRYPQSFCRELFPSASSTHHHEEPRRNGNYGTPNVQESCASRSTNAVSNSLQWQTGRNVDQPLPNGLPLIDERFNTNSIFGPISPSFDRAPGAERSHRRMRERMEREARIGPRFCSTPVKVVLPNPPEQGFHADYWYDSELAGKVVVAVAYSIAPDKAAKYPGMM